MSPHAVVNSAATAAQNTNQKPSSFSIAVLLGCSDALSESFSGYTYVYQIRPLYGVIRQKKGSSEGGRAFFMGVNGGWVRSVALAVGGFHPAVS